LGVTIMGDEIFAEEFEGGRGSVLRKSIPLLMEDLSPHFYRVIWDILVVSKKMKKGRRGNFAISISSCNRGEGASTIALNLAVAFSANSLKRILLVDANLRHPVLHDYFGVGREGGLVELVNGEISLKDGVREIPEHAFDFLSAGFRIQNPVLLFEAPAFMDVVEQMRALYDLIIFDSSPVVPYPETPILGSATDGLILVVEAEHTRWEVGQAAKHDLEVANVNILGSILNKKEFFIPQLIYRML
jgi:protein-tyrosine kinase